MSCIHVVVSENYTKYRTYLLCTQVVASEKYTSFRSASHVVSSGVAQSLLGVQRIHQNICSFRYSQRQIKSRGYLLYSRIFSATPKVRRRIQLDTEDKGGQSLSRINSYLDLTLQSEEK